MADVIVFIHKAVKSVGWLQQQLQDLQQHPTEAAAARVPPVLLHELLQLADTMQSKFDKLGRSCIPATTLMVSNPYTEAEVYSACQQGCAEGWLTEGLQQLGSKVWATWPQKYACNDDQCLNLGGLTEQACARHRCSGCKARVENLYCNVDDSRSAHWSKNTATVPLYSVRQSQADRHLTACHARPSDASQHAGRDAKHSGVYQARKLL
jgi:hypothetical protein